MRTIERTGQFKRDYKREAKGRLAKMLDHCFMASYPHWSRISQYFGAKRHWQHATSAADGDWTLNELDFNTLATSLCVAPDGLEAGRVLGITQRAL
jgi:hypothetical protein